MKQLTERLGKSISCSNTSVPGASRISAIIWHIKPRMSALDRRLKPLLSVYLDVVTYGTFSVHRIEVGLRPLGDTGQYHPSSSTRQGLEGALSTITEHRGPRWDHRGLPLIITEVQRQRLIVVLVK